MTKITKSSFSEVNFLKIPNFGPPSSGVSEYQNYLTLLKVHCSLIVFLLGVNKYRLEKEDDIDVLVIDNEAVKKQQIERLNKVKETRDQDKAKQSLENLAQAANNSLNAGENGNNCLAAAVECARARCTVGEITDTMAKVRSTFGKIVDTIHSVSEWI